MNIANKKSERTTTVLFLCTANACRSQMAERIAKDISERLYPGAFEIYSAGTKPDNSIPNEVNIVMTETGYSIAEQRPKAINELPIKNADVVVTMGCDVVCPFFPNKKLIEWDIDDPIGAGLDEFRNVRDEIKKLVSSLLEHFATENK